MPTIEHCGEQGQKHGRHVWSEVAEFGKRHPVIDYICPGTTQQQADEHNTPEDDPEVVAEALRCEVCYHIIHPTEFRFKVWKTDERGNTTEREYVHLSHLGDLT